MELINALLVEETVLNVNHPHLDVYIVKQVFTLITTNVMLNVQVKH
jgi:hypothetical protein